MAQVRWQRRREVLWRAALGQLVVLVPDRADAVPLVVTSPGAAVWALLEEPVTLEEIAATLAEVFGVDPATVEHDLEPVISQLAEAGAIAPV